MPVIKSAIKKLRRDRKVEQLNDAKRANFERALKAAKKQKTASSIKSASSAVDRAVKNKLIHKNRAARIKSSLAKIAKPQASKTTTSKTAIKPKAPAKSASKKKK